MSTVGKTLYLLTTAEKRRGALVLALVVVMAFLEVIGVAAVMPFLTVLGNPGIVYTNPYLAGAYEFLGLDSVDDFLVALGIGAFLLILFSSAFRTLTHYVMNRFIEMRRHSIAMRLLEMYLRQPYAFFLNHHSSDMAKKILSEIDQVVGSAFRPGMQMLAYGVVMLAIVIFILIIDPVIAIGVTAVIGGSYILVFIAVRGLLNRIGVDRAHANSERFTTASEALGGIKDVKLLGMESSYLKRFEQPSARMARHMATSQTLSQVPKYLIEAIGFGGIIALTLILFMRAGGEAGAALGEVLPMIGLYTFSAYRLLPAVQHVYHGISRIRFGAAAVDGVYQDLHQRSALVEELIDGIAPITPRRNVALDHVSFTYPYAASPALTEIDLSIPVGTSIGLVGSTGAGKTTLVDVLLGLLRPTEGVISVDGEPVTDAHLRRWQRSLGYVPQDIFLTDASVWENIALGMSVECIDRDQVMRCARMAQVHDFVISSLPEGYDTSLGERGVRISGGQRQRIGIARALYHEPQILVFDEATSALDAVTECAVMDAIDSLVHQKSIILIAHRLSTVLRCDKIALLENGRVVDVGPFNDLEQRSAAFRALAGSTEGGVK